MLTLYGVSITAENAQHILASLLQGQSRCRSRPAPSDVSSPCWVGGVRDWGMGPH